MLECGQADHCLEVRLLPAQHLGPGRVRQVRLEEAAAGAGQVGRALLGQGQQPGILVHAGVLRVAAPLLQEPSQPPVAAAHVQDSGRALFRTLWDVG